MPDYVCPECGEPVMSRAVLIEGTLMHHACHIRLRDKVRTDAIRRVDAFIERRRARAAS